MTRALSRTAAWAFALGAVFGCTDPSGPEADTAWIEVEGEDRIVVELSGCGLDERTVLLVAADEEATLQVVVVLDEDDEAVLGEVAVTVFRDAAEGAAPALGAIGNGAAPRLDAAGPVGEVISARVQGARVQVTVDAEVLDSDLGGTGEPAGELRIDANCPATSEA